jgi:hypothetical protein
MGVLHYPNVQKYLFFANWQLRAAATPIRIGCQAR